MFGMVALLKWKVMSAYFFVIDLKLMVLLEDDDNSPKNKISCSLLTCCSKFVRSSSKLKAIFNILF